MKTNADPSVWRDTVIRGLQAAIDGHKNVSAGLEIIKTAREEFRKVSLHNDSKRK